MTLEVSNADEWLESYFTGEYFSGKFEHLKSLIYKLKLNHGFQKIITIAGTNGKGETCRRLSQLLYENNNHYACWTSPHLFSAKERFHFNGALVDDSELIQVFGLVKKLIDDLHIDPLSYFEFLFVCFLFLAKNKKSQYLILEVGLGGRLDAANCLDADICAITSISRDHQAFLGHRYKSILKEKMGILRKKTSLYSALELTYLQQMVAKKVKSDDIKWIDGFFHHVLDLNNHFSSRNQFIAESIFKELFSDNRQLFEKLNKLNFTKRYELIVGHHQIDFYSSHNVDGVRKLVQFLSQSQYNKYNYLIISFSERDLEDLRVMIRILLKHFGKAKVFLYKFSHPKAISSSKLNLIKDEFNLEITDKNTIYTQFTKSADKERFLCTGSQYFFTDIISTLKGHVDK